MRKVLETDAFHYLSEFVIYKTMKKIWLILYSMWTLLAVSAESRAPYLLVPAPVHMECAVGEFVLPGQWKIHAERGLHNEYHRLKEGLEQAGRKVSSALLPAKADVLLELDEDVLPGQSEGYELAVTPERVEIRGNAPAGVYYGVQTFLQLMHNAGKILACGHITDYPAFRWRAFMLDEARYFKGEKEVYRLLDAMAELKMNVFHWHLTDHQGWRLEIKKYPKLTGVGGYRDSSMVGSWGSNRFDGKPHFGFYTQKQIRKILRYAAERHITIVPEIDMPGHSTAAIAAYPEMGTTGIPVKVPCVFGPQYEAYDVTRNSVKDFLKDILMEVIALFPSTVIHIGGDEVRFNQWEASPSIRRYMVENGIATPAELQLRFTNEMSNWLANKGRRMMGWNEITGDKLHDYHQGNAAGVQSRLSPRSIVHFWKGDPNLMKKAIRRGHDIVNSYHLFTYLDYNYKAIPLKKAYSFHPVPDGLSVAEQRKVLGVGCQMWGEFIPTVKDMHRQVFPRIAAIAEVGWTLEENKDYQRFLQGLDLLETHWRGKGIIPADCAR